MKNNTIKKYTLAFGGLAAVAAPVAAVVACGSSSSDSGKEYTDTSVTTTGAALLTALSGKTSTITGTSVVDKSDEYVIKGTYGSDNKELVLVIKKDGTFVSLTDDGTKVEDTEVFANAAKTSGNVVTDADEFKAQAKSQVDGIKQEIDALTASTGTGTGSTAPTKFEYKGTQYDNITKAQEAVNHDLSAVKVWGFTGSTTEYTTEYEAKDEFVKANASTGITQRSTMDDVTSLTSAGAPEGGFSVASGVKQAFLFGGKYYQTEAAAQQAWLTQAGGTKTQGVDTITYTAQTAAGTVTLPKTTEDVTRDSDTATTAPTISIANGAKSGHDGVAGVTGNAGTAKAKALPSSPSPTDTIIVDGDTYTYAAEVTAVAAVTGTQGWGAGYYTAAPVATDPAQSALTPDGISGYTAAANDTATIGGTQYTYYAEVASDGSVGIIAAGWYSTAPTAPAVSTDTTTPDTVDLTDTTVGNIINGKTYYAAEAHVDPVAEVVHKDAGWYNGTTALSGTTFYEKAGTPAEYVTTTAAAEKENVVTAVTAVSNSEVMTYDIKSGSTTIGTLVVKSPEFGTNAPTTSFTTPTDMDTIVTVTVSEKTPFVANQLTDATGITSLNTTSAGWTAIGTSGSATTPPSAAAHTVYIFGTNAYPTMDDAKAAFKAAITATEVAQKDSANKVTDGTTEYANKQAAYTALITSVTVTSSKAELLYHV